MKITVTGTVAEGKTTIALLIAEALSKAGIEFNLHDEDVTDWSSSSTSLLQGQRLRALSEKGLCVDIDTVQTSRTEQVVHNQCERLKEYARIHKLEFHDKASLVRDWGAEEWEGVQAAAFAQFLPSSAGEGPMVAFVDDQGVVSVVAFYTTEDDKRWARDKFVELEANELDSAIRHRRALHAEWKGVR